MPTLQLLPPQELQEQVPEAGLSHLPRAVGPPAFGTRVWAHALHCCQEGEPHVLEGWWMEESIPRLPLPRCEPLKELSRCPQGGEDCPPLTLPRVARKSGSLS